MLPFLWVREGARLLAEEGRGIEATVGVYAFGSGSVSNQSHGMEDLN
jgi:hypothetical protein